jgi:MFS family permease
MSAENNSPSGQNFQTGGWRAHWILIICSLLYMINYMDRNVLTVVLQPIKLEMGLTDTELGILQTVFILSIALFSFPIAFMIDRWSRRKSIGLMAIVWSGFTAVTGLARNFTGLLIPRALVGVGEAGFSAGGTAMITAAYPKNKHGWALGFFNLAITLGIAIGTIVGGVLATSMGWRSPFFVFAVLGLLAGIAAFFMKDYKTVHEDVSGGIKGFGQSIVAIFKIPTMKWFFIGYGVFSIMAQALLAWLPAYLMRQMEWTAAQAGTTMGVVGLLAIIGAPLGGILADYWNKKNRRGHLYLPALASFISAVAMVTAFLLFPVSFAVGVAFAAMYGIFSVMPAPPLGIVSQNVIPPAHKGLSWGLTVFAMYFLGGAWSPWLTGAISDSLGGGARGLQWACIIASIGGVLGAVCFLVGARTYPADVDRVKDSVLQSEK